MARLNQSQRIVIVIGLAAALYVFGMWAMTWGSELSRVWVGYAPLSSALAGPDVSGLHLWLRLAIWLALTALWVGGALLVLRDPRHRDES